MKDHHKNLLPMLTVYHTSQSVLFYLQQMQPFEHHKVNHTKLVLHFCREKYIYFILFCHKTIVKNNIWVLRCHGHSIAQSCLTDTENIRNFAV